MISGFREQLIQAYDRQAEKRDHLGMEPWKEAERKRFYDLLIAEGKSKMLEIGSGPGRDGLFFRENGFEIVCTDLSQEMVRRCRAKGLRAEIMDAAELCFPDQTFDAVYSLNSLLHVPKAQLPAVLAGIKRVLNPDGLFYFGVYGGQVSEGIWEEDSYEPKRFFSMYTDLQIRELVSQCFEWVTFQTIPLGDGKPHFQSMILRKPIP